MRGGWVGLGLLAYIAPVLAQQPLSVAEARFQVSGYAVEGRALLKSEDFTRVVSSYVGRGKTAADLERARLALQDTYHNLGHCTVRVALTHPEPKDGMVTFRVSEVPASELRDCLPALVLDEPSRRGPAARAVPRSAGAATAFSYADQRDSAAPALKPRAPAAAASLAAAPRSESIGQTASAPASAGPLRRPDSRTSSATAAPRAAGAESGQAAAAPGVAIAPYVEGAGARGFSVLSAAPARDSPRLVPEAPAKPFVAAPEPAKPVPPTPVATVPLAEARPSVAAPVIAAVEPASAQR